MLKGIHLLAERGQSDLVAKRQKFYDIAPAVVVEEDCGVELVVGLTKAPLGGSRQRAMQGLERIWPSQISAAGSHAGYAELRTWVVGEEPDLDAVASPMPHDAAGFPVEPCVLQEPMEDHMVAWQEL